MVRYLLPLLLAVPCFGLTVRVQETPGGPQIHVDGKPIAPRFFFGSYNDGYLVIDTQWQEMSYDFIPGDVAGGGTLHFRFEQKPGEIWLKDLRIIDVETREDVMEPGSFATQERFNAIWSTWPTDEQNTVGQFEIADGALHVTLSEPPVGEEWPDFHFHSINGMSFERGRTYRCIFNAKADSKRILTSSLYNVANNLWSNIGGIPGSFLEQVALARDAGVNLVSFGTPNSWHDASVPNPYDAIDALCKKIIAVNPNVLLVPRVGADAPGWWLDNHPDSRMVYDGDQAAWHSCVSDRVYRADVCTHLEELSRHLLETFPNNFAGIHPCGQNTGEWFYQDSWGFPLSGYDADTKAAFKQWLKDKGLPEVEVPTADDRRAHPFGLLRDPELEWEIIEFNRFFQQEMADHVLAMAEACRKGTDGQKLVVFFFGYLFEFAPMGTGEPNCGHLAMSSVMQSPDIDILCSPISYTDREWIGTAPSMTTAESVRLTGKMWLNEDDSRTFLDPRTQEHVQEGGLVNLQQTQQVMLRNTAQAAMRGFGTWWMDLPAKGWFNDARIWDVMEQLRRTDQAMLHRPEPFTPDIAAIVDEDSLCHFSGGSDNLGRGIIYDSRASLGRSGTAYGQYLLDDLLVGKVPSKLQFLLAAWALTPQEREALKANRGENVTRVWCYAPGYIYPDRQDVAGINEVTGFEAYPVNLENAMVTPTPAGQQLGLLEDWGVNSKIDPLFAVKATPEETLATYSDGSPAVVLRQTANGIDVFSGVPKLTPELVRALAKLTGIHLYTEDNSAVWVANNFLSVQVHKTGPLTVDFGQPCEVYDALTAEQIGIGPKTTMQCDEGEVRVFKY